MKPPQTLSFRFYATMPRSVHLCPERHRSLAEARLLRGTRLRQIDSLDSPTLFAVHFEMPPVRTDVSLAGSLLCHVSPPKFDVLR